MAITINQWPIGGTAITMAHNPVEFVVTSTNTAQPNFKYIADLTWTSGTTAVRFIQGANPINGKCRFDFSSVLRNVVTYDPPIGGSTNDFYDCKNSYSTLTVQFGEQYGASSAVINYTNLQSDGMYIWNACLPIDRWWNNTNPTTAYAIGTNAKKFLTDYPFRVQGNGIKVCYNDLHYLYFLQNNTVDDVYQVKFELYKGGSVWNTITWDCPAAIDSTKNVVRIGAGPKNLQNSGTELNYYNARNPNPCIDSEVEYYSVQLLDDKANPLTEELFFSIECECSWETPYRLCFLNKLGGYDFFNFNWNSKKTSSYQKSYFERKAWNWSSSNAVQYNSHNRGKVQYSTIGTDKLQLTSGWITEEESTWLEELISSPDVYIIDNTTGQLTAVTVTDTQYDYKTLEYDQLFNLTITLDFAFNRYRQSI